MLILFKKIALYYKKNYYCLPTIKKVTKKHCPIFDVSERKVKRVGNSGHFSFRLLFDSYKSLYSFFSDRKCENEHTFVVCVFFVGQSDSENGKRWHIHGPVCQSKLFCGYF